MNDEGSILLGGQDITFAPEHQRSKVIGHAEFSRFYPVLVRQKRREKRNFL